MPPGSEIPDVRREAALEWYVVEGRRLEARRIPARVCSRPPIVFLHEGLGSVSHWRDFPERVAAATGSEIFVYSRYGHGRSSLLQEARGGSYMHHEAAVVLPSLLKQADIRQPVLLGHSDGASIAILYAAKFSNSAAALILEAPHVFVEDLTLDGIAAARTAYLATDLPQKLARYHDDADRTFWGWNDIWLNPQFRFWNIEHYLDAIRCPVLVIQGEDDEYGTTRQLAAVQARIPASEVALFPECKHAPHRDQPELTLRRIVAFLESLAAE